MAGRRDVTISENLAGQRLDRALAELLPEISRTRLQALIADDRVTGPDGKPVAQAKRKVHAGEKFVVIVPDPTPARPEGQEIPLSVIYEDEHLIVIDKPKGLVVHPAPGNPDRTLVNALIAHCGEGLSGIGGVQRPGIVHRLDKDTSGLMVVAKTDQAHRGLSEQFESHAIDRAYLAVVWGVPMPPSGTVAGNIGRDPRNRKKMAVRREGGKPAVTHYRVIERYGDAAALVECRLETGRTHQIRVHMASIGHPVVGDPLYAGRRGRRSSHIPDGNLRLSAFNTQSLHAYILGFRHPVTGEFLRFSSEKPIYFKELSDIFRQS